MKPKDERKEIPENTRGRRLDKTLGRDARREIMRKVKGKRENAHIYRAQR